MKGQQLSLFAHSDLPAQVSPPDPNGPRCSRCSSTTVKVIGNGQIQSGKAIGICQDCGENFVIGAHDCHFCADTGKLGHWAFCFCDKGQAMKQARLEEMEAQGQGYIAKPDPPPAPVSRYDCQICKDTGRLVGSYVFCFCSKGKEMERERCQESALDQARTLASGTIATLTGLNRYEDIEEVQAQFVDWIADDNPPDAFECWQDAWDAFHREGGLRQ